MLELHEIMTPAEKIREYRKQLKVTQEGLAGNGIERSYISKIENGNGELTPAKAAVLAENINNIASRKNIDIHVTKEYLLEDPEMQAKKNIDNAIIELNHIDNIDTFKNRFSLIDHYMSQYTDLMSEETKYNFYNLAAKKFYRHNRFGDCKLYILKCLELASWMHNDNLTAPLLLTLARVYAFMKDYKTAIGWGELLLSKNCDDLRTIKDAHFVIAKAYKLNGDLAMCLYWLEVLKRNYMLDSEDILKSDLLEANCIREGKDYKKTEKMYLDILNVAINIDSKMYTQLAYANLGELYNITGKYEKALMYMEKALDIYTEYFDSHDVKPFIIYTAFDICLNLKDPKLQEYFAKTTELLEEACNESMKVITYSKLLNYYIEQKNDESILDLLQLIESKIDEDKINDKEIIDVFYIASRYFANTDKFDEIYDKIFNLIKKFKEKKYK